MASISSSMSTTLARSSASRHERETLSMDRPDAAVARVIAVAPGQSPIALGRSFSLKLGGRRDRRDDSHIAATRLGNPRTVAAVDPGFLGVKKPGSRLSNKDR